MAVSFTVSAAEMPDVNIRGDVVRDAEDSQSDEEQTAAASNESAPEGTKAWLPSAQEYDWIQLSSNEWLKGKINGMYKDSLEFDSDKLDLLEIHWGDVKVLRSSRVSDVNIEGIGSTSGMLEVMEGRIRISNDYEDKTYDRSSLISFAPAGKKERDLWSVKATLSFDAKKGNTDQLDYTGKLNMKRRSSTTRFLLDYIGNISKTNGGDGSLVETINNHRLKQSYVPVSASSPGRISHRSSHIPWSVIPIARSINSSTGSPRHHPAPGHSTVCLLSAVYR
jgi:hypothetical protein